MSVDSELFLNFIKSSLSMNTFEVEGNGPRNKAIAKARVQLTFTLFDREKVSTESELCERTEQKF